MKGLTAVVNELKADGFVMVRMKRHSIWRCPCGHTQLVCNTTQGRGNGDTYMRSLIARTLRVCKANMSATKREAA